MWTGCARHAGALVATDTADTRSAIFTRHSSTVIWCREVNIIKYYQFRSEVKIQLLFLLAIRWHVKDDKTCMDVYSFTCLFCLQFSFINHSFLLNTATKSLAMYYDSRIRMINERRTAIVNSLIHGSPHAPYLRLRVRRDHLIDDALVEVCDM